MLVYRRNGQTHLFCYLADRFIMHAPQNEGAAALDRQRVDDFLEPAQFVARLQHPLGRPVVHQQVDVGDLVERDDLGAARLVDDQVARDLEQIGAPGGELRIVDRRIGPRHHLGDEIVEIVATRQHAAQAAPQRGLMRQYRCLEPIQFRSDRHARPTSKLESILSRTHFLFLRRPRTPTWRRMQHRHANATRMARCDHSPRADPPRQRHRR